MKKRNIFISFSFNENHKWKKELINFLRNHDLIVDYSEKKDWREEGDEKVWKELSKRIKGSSITILLFSKDLSGEKGKCELVDNFKISNWIYKEISLSLYDGNKNRINGIIVLYKNNLMKKNCNNKHVSTLHFNEEMLPKIIKENRFNIKDKFKSKETNDLYDVLKDHYISVISWEQFIKNPNKYIENSFEKRTKQINNKEFNIKHNFNN